MSKRRKKLTGESRNPYNLSLQGKTQKQKKYINLINNMQVVLATGYAGTGKSYIPAMIAAQQLKDLRSPIEKIVICRPNTGVGKTIGLLPGTQVEKMKPWCLPILDTLEHALGKSELEYMLMVSGAVELLPLEYARGRSFNNSFVILDEAQNIDKESLKCLLLRIGQDSKLVIDGDIRQCDIGETSGLKPLMNLMDNYEMPIGHVDFSLEDVVRGDLCKYLLEVFEQSGF